MGIGLAKPRRLVVEGFQDLYSVQGIMRAHIDWPDGKDNAPVWIEIANGVEGILKAGVIGAKLKESGLQALGVMLDADEKLTARYDHIREQCIGEFPHIPKKPPAEGVVVSNDDGKRFGLWIMPDNTSPGYLEMFLQYLVPQESKPLWDHAIQSFATAKTIGAACKDAHIGKAHLYTWLAWQDEPGQYPGAALTQKILDPQSASANPFVNWFKKLYGL